jgi:hypothetical protein
MVVEPLGGAVASLIAAVGAPGAGGRAALSGGGVRNAQPASPFHRSSLIPQASRQQKGTPGGSALQRRLLQQAAGGSAGDDPAAAAAQWLSQLMRLPFFGRPPANGGFSSGNGSNGADGGDEARAPPPSPLPSTGGGRAKLTTARRAGGAAGGSVDAALTITFVSTGAYAYLMRGPATGRTMAAHVLRHPDNAPLSVVGGIPYADQASATLQLPVGDRYTLELRDEGELEAGAWIRRRRCGGLKGLVGSRGSWHGRKCDRRQRARSVSPARAWPSQAGARIG